jgi:hypothetical protein
MLGSVDASSTGACAPLIMTPSVGAPLDLDAPGAEVERVVSHQRNSEFHSSM